VYSYRLIFLLITHKRHSLSAVEFLSILGSNLLSSLSRSIHHFLAIVRVHFHNLRLFCSEFVVLIISVRLSSKVVMRWRRIVISIIIKRNLTLVNSRSVVIELCRLILVSCIVIKGLLSRDNFDSWWVDFRIPLVWRGLLRVSKFYLSFL